MILTLIIENIKKSNKKQLIVWIQKDNKEFESDVKQLLEFFKDSIDVVIARKFKTRYYKITSKNPAIMMSLFSAVHDLIPEVYFTDDEPIEIEALNIEGLNL